MARLRHGQGRRLPRRPARRAAPHRRGDRRDLRARAVGTPVQPDAGRDDRPAALRRTHREPRRAAGQARLLRGRPHRAHDPADALPAVREAGRPVLQRVLLPRPAARRTTAAPRAWWRYELATGELHVFRAKSVLFATGGYGRMFRVSSNAHALTGDGPVGRVPARHPARGHGVLPVPPDRPLPARRAALRGGARRGRRSCGTATASASWSATPRRSRTSPRATSCRRSIYQEIKEGRGTRPERRLRPTSTSRTSTRR